jgi:hypothetical protein
MVIFADPKNASFVLLAGLFRVTTLAKLLYAAYVPIQLDIATPKAISNTDVKYGQRLSHTGGAAIKNQLDMHSRLKPKSSIEITYIHLEYNEKYVLDVISGGVSRSI